MGHHETTRVVNSPLDRLKPVTEDLYVVDSGPHRAFGIPVPVRMTVVRLRGGGIWLHSPTRHTAALDREIGALGSVTHLVAPNIAHWSYLKEWQVAHPEARTWAAPGLRRRRQVRASGVRLDVDLGEDPPSDWSGEIDQCLLRGGLGLTEVAFLHRPSRALILTDLVENFEPDRVSPLVRPLVRLGGSLAPDGMAPPHYRFAMNRNRPEVQAAARHLVDWAPERVIFAHGAWFKTDGTARLRRSLRWLLD